MKKILAGMLAVMLAFGLVACGGSASSAAPASSAAGGSSTAASEPASSEATGDSDGIEAIKASGKLVMMTNATFPPYEYIKNGEPTGVDVELAQMIADELGVELEILDMDFDLLTDALKSGKGDLVAAGMSIDEERAQQVDFSVPYVDSTIMIVVAEGSEITGPDDLVGKKISVQESTTSDLYVTDNVEAGEILRFKDAVEAGRVVQNGKADVAVIDVMTAKNVVAASNGALVLLDGALANEQYAMAVAKGDAGLLALVDEVLQKAVDEGKVEELIAFHMENSKEA